MKFKTITLFALLLCFAQSSAQTAKAANHFVNEIYFVLKTDTITNKTITIKRAVTYKFSEGTQLNQETGKQEKKTYYTPSIDSIPQADIAKIDSIYCDGKNIVKDIKVGVTTNGSDKFYEKPIYRNGLKYNNQPHNGGVILLYLLVVNPSGQAQELYFRIFLSKKRK